MNCPPTVIYVSNYFQLLFICDIKPHEVYLDFIIIRFAFHVCIKGSWYSFCDVCLTLIICNIRLTIAW